MDAQTRALLESTIQNNDIVLFMKGTRHAPQCGFSARVVQILDSLGTEYQSVDVLANPQVREGVKEFSSWPTIPQLYIRQEFIGGCDIVTELYSSGELAKKLGAKPPEAPKVHVTQKAQQALGGALEEEGDCVRLEVGQNWAFGLSVSSKQPGDFEIEVGDFTLLVDPMSATRADGTTIDCVDTEEGQAFRIENPKEPPRVKPLTPKDLKAKLDGSEPLILVDVRTPEEARLARIEGGRLLDEAFFRELTGEDKEKPLVFFCHHGTRSAQAAQEFIRQGFRQVYNLTGGIDAWSRDIDSSVPRY